MPAFTQRDVPRLRAARGHLAVRPLLALVLAGSPTSAMASGCQALAGYESFEPKPPHPCDSLGAEKDDRKGLARMVLSKQPDGSCYWVDKTEVTVEQYAAFLSDVKDSEIAWHRRCGWKTSPSDPVSETDHPCTVGVIDLESDAFRDTKPIRCVDWCDAQAYCRWAGKELCGGLANAGGVVEPQDVPDEWGNACSEFGLPYPYGDGATSIPGWCNVGLDEGDCFSKVGQRICAPADVASFPECTGPFGAVDMVGNVAEWVLMCGFSQDEDEREHRCHHRGGSFADDAETCYHTSTAERQARLRTLGLRCCTSLTLAEASLVE